MTPDQELSALFGRILEERLQALHYCQIWGRDPAWLKGWEAGVGLLGQIAALEDPLNGFKRDIELLEGESTLPYWAGLRQSFLEMADQCYRMGFPERLA